MINKGSKTKLSAFIVCLAMLFVFLVLVPSAFAYDSEELAFFNQINYYRAINGLPALSLSPSLTTSSQGHSCDMAARNYFSHTSLDGRTYVDRIRGAGYYYNTWLGENIAAGYSSAASVFSGWQNSPGHNALMLSGNFRAIGIDRCYGGNSQYGWYWTTDFGGVVEPRRDVIGSLDNVRLVSPNLVHIRGWAIDTDTAASIPVHIYVDGVPYGAVTASESRPDVGAAYPNYGANHGYSSDIRLSSGSHTVCTYGINNGAGDNAQLGCKAAYVPVNPFGNLERVSTGNIGEINLSGWAIDPDTANAIDVHVYVNGVFAGPLTADGSRPDIGSAFRDYGNLHGFSGSFAARPGSNTVCAYGINSGPGNNALLGCRAVYVPVNPFGNLDRVTAGNPGELNLSGWAIDPDVASAIDVHVYVNGTYSGVFPADGSRTDIGNVFPVYGPNHGFSGTVAVRSASNTVCAYGINASQTPGNNVLLGCRTLNVSVNPFGAFDPTNRNGDSVALAGWVIDPNTSLPTDVHIYVDGRNNSFFTANVYRQDVGAAFPLYGSYHGFSSTLDVSPGTHTVCVYGINSGPGNNVLLGCRAV